MNFKLHLGSLKKRSLGIVSLMLLVCVVGCRSKEVTPTAKEYANITFEVGWLSIDKLAQTPKSLSVWLYPRIDGQSVIQFDVNTGESVTKQVPVGTYDMVAYNAADLKEVLTVGQESFFSHSAYLQPDNENYIKQAEFLHTLKGASIKILEVLPDLALSVRFNPSTVTKIYKLNVDVISASEFKSGKASLSGLKTKYMFKTGEVLSDFNAKLSFDLQQNTKVNNSFFGDALIMGIESDTDGTKNIVTVHLKYVDEEKPPVNIEFDITESVKTNPNSNLEINVGVDVTTDKPKIESIWIVPFGVVEGGEIVIDPIDNK